MMTGRPRVARSTLGALITVPLLVIGVLLAASLGSPSTATAATSLGTLAVSPGSGTDIATLTLTTVSTGATKGCPDGFRNAKGVVSGPTAAWTDILAVTNTSVGISNTAEFSVQVSDSMAGIAQSNTLQIAIGKYTFTVQCTNPLGSSDGGVWTGSIWFTTTTQWQATDPALPPPTPTGTTTPSATPTPTVSPTPGVTPTPTPTPTPAPSTTPPAGSDPAPLLGTLTFDPPTGTDLATIFINTKSTGATKGCPTPASNYVGFFDAPAAWVKDPQLIAVQNGRSGLSNTAEFQMALTDTFNGIAAANNLTIAVGRYDITVYCTNPLGSSRLGRFTGSLWFTDATHYQSTDPATSQSTTTTSLVSAPDARADRGESVTFTASVTPATAAGNIVFTSSLNGASSTLATVPLSGGKALVTKADLEVGLYYVTAAFQPTDAAKAKASASKDVTFVIAPVKPATPPDSVTISGTAKVGQTLTCGGAFTAATTTTTSWVRDRRPIAGGTAATYKLVAADKGALVQCRRSGTNAGGTTVRTSAGVTVTS